MKKFSTRLIALMMALTMVMSCGAFASAAEPEEMPESNVEVIELPSNSSVASPMSVVTTIGGCELENVEKDASISKSVGLADPGRVIWKFGVIGKCRVTIITTYNGKRTLYSDDVYENVSIAKVTPDVLPRGTVVDYKITAEGHVDKAVLLIQLEK